MRAAKESKNVVDLEIILGTVATLLYFSLVLPDHGTFWLYLVLKPIPVLFMAVWAFRNGSPPYRNFVVAGLLCAMIGDVILVWKNNQAFLWGLVAFLIAHLIYVAGFSYQNRELRIGRLVPYALFSGALYWFLLPNLGGMTLPVLAYVLAITAMMWRAAARVGRSGRATRYEIAGAVGAVLFAASDTQLAINRFYMPIDGIAYGIMSTYWLGQACIAWSVKDRG